MSTVDAVSRLVAGIVEGFKEGKTAAATLCYLSKAFDCVDHRRRIAKLETFFEFRGLTLQFFSLYLQN